MVLPVKDQVHGWILLNRVDPGLFKTAQDVVNRSVRTDFLRSPSATLMSIFESYPLIGFHQVLRNGLIANWEFRFFQLPR
jgi:hypothetical protein